MRQWLSKLVSTRLRAEETQARGWLAREAAGCVAEGTRERALWQTPDRQGRLSRVARSHPPSLAVETTG